MMPRRATRQRSPRRACLAALAGLVLLQLAPLPGVFGQPPAAAASAAACCCRLAGPGGGSCLHCKMCKTSPVPAAEHAPLDLRVVLTRPVAASPLALRGRLGAPARAATPWFTPSPDTPPPRAAA